MKIMDEMKCILDVMSVVSYDLCIMYSPLGLDDAFIPYPVHPAVVVAVL